MISLPILLSLVFVCGTGFTLVNGMNDVSGSIGSLCSSRAANVRQARLLAIFGMWIGILLSSDLVSRTVALELANLTGTPPQAALGIWLSALLGSIAWVALARRMGIPTSSTHTFIGSLCGATLFATADWQKVNWGWQSLCQGHRAEGVMKVFLGLICSPLIGGGLGYFLFRLLSRCLRRATIEVNQAIRRCELGTVLVQSITYGMNDAHTAMGILAGASLSLYPHEGSFAVSLPIKLTIGLALSLGALLGSHNIMRTMGRGLFLVRPAEALAGQAGAALSVLAAAQMGAPVSSSQVTSSALVGAGGAWRPQHVRWRRVRDILLTWVITFPCAATIGAMANAMVRTVFSAMSTFTSMLGWGAS